MVLGAFVARARAPGLRHAHVEQRHQHAAVGHFQRVHVLGTGVEHEHRARVARLGEANAEVPQERDVIERAGVRGHSDHRARAAVDREDLPGDVSTGIRAQ